MEAERAKRIKELQKEKDVVILAHYYVDGAVQEIADYVGDSYYLAELATTVPQPLSATTAAQRRASSQAAAMRSACTSAVVEPSRRARSAARPVRAMTASFRNIISPTIRPGVKRPASPCTRRCGSATLARHRRQTRCWRRRHRY